MYLSKNIQMIIKIKMINEICLHGNVLGSKFVKNIFVCLMQKLCHKKVESATTYNLVWWVFLQNSWYLEI